ncbi:MAG: HAMP domain-containing histidine kinase, partial [Planctomycetes bacterium]|nr:HAMP domain-containing histidine kinase [Planctomycetota bacterium]
ITCAALTAVILAPATYFLYAALARGYEAESIAEAAGQARAVADSLLGQLSDDLMIEFDGPPLRFGDFAVKAADWAVFRADGTLVHGTGAFARESVLRMPEPEQLFEHSPGEPMRAASIPLFRDASSSIDDLAPAIRRAVDATMPEAPFLNAKRETSGGSIRMEVKKLAGDRIEEFVFAEDGTCVETDTEALPEPIDEGFLAFLPAGKIPTSDTRLSWREHDGQLIAVLEGIAASGAPVRHAFNRLGERFVLDDAGAIAAPDPSSRLFVAAAASAYLEQCKKRALQKGLLLGAAVVWLGLVLAGAFVARRAMSPVKGIVQSARRVRLGKPGGRVPVGRANDELASIAKTINEMLERIETGYERERQFTGDASHELRGPIAKIQADAEVALARERTAAEYREALHRIAGYARHMKGVVESLLILARLEGGKEQLQKEPFDLAELIIETAGTLPRTESNRVHLDLGAAASAIHAFGQRGLIGAALHSLIENALRYSPADSKVQIRVEPNGRSVLIAVEDRGPGIPPELRDRVFDRFFRVDPARARESGGSGLGLAIVRAVAAAHGTTVELRSAPTGGTIAILAVPAAGG